MSKVLASLLMVGLAAVLAWLFAGLLPYLLNALLGGVGALSLMLVQLLATQVAVGRWLQRESIIATATLLAIVGIAYFAYSGSLWQHTVLLFLVLGAWIGGLRFKVSSFVLFLLCSCLGAVLL